MLSTILYSKKQARCSHRPQRVEGLWSAHPRLRAISISASEFSTLVLTMPPKVSSGSRDSSSLATLPVNTVYSWGHGNHQVMRVIFPTETNSLTSTRRGNVNNNNVYSRSICTNPVAIACAKYHNVAITEDGRVFTWGLHSESLGIEKTATPSKKNDGEWTTATDDRRRPRSNSLQGNSVNSPSSSTISSPQLVVGMLVSSFLCCFLSILMYKTSLIASLAARKRWRKGSCCVSIRKSYCHCYSRGTFVHLGNVDWY